MTGTFRVDLADAFARYGRGSFQDAATICRRFLALAPETGGAMHLLSLCAYQLLKLDEAERRLRRVKWLVIGTDLADALVNRASALLSLGRHDEALHSIADAIATGFAGARALSTRGAIYRASLRPREALGANRQAAALEPWGADTWIAIGNAHQLAGDIAEAVAAYTRAIAVSPGNIVAHGNRIFTLCFAEGTDDAMLFRAARMAGRAIEAGSPTKRLKSRPRARLRIGYHSSEFFSRSAIDDVFPPVLAHHDRDRFDLILISDGGRADSRTDDLRRNADSWIDIAGLDLGGKVARMREARLDIAVCLTGYLAIQRVAFAQRVAPVQVAFMNHVATTGMRAFDYRITDEWLDPPGLTEQWNVERLTRLDAGYVPMLPPAHAPAISALPARANGFVTFGSFNNLSKVTPATLALWAKPLAALPSSRLLLKARALDADDVRTRYLQLAGEAGIDPARIDMIGSVAGESDHLTALGRADVALDPVPFAGGRTTIETLTMGVPVINRRSPSMMGRLGASLLSRAGLGNLATTTNNEFADVAVALARDLDALEKLRLGMRDRLASTPLCDAAAFTRELESAYEEMSGAPRPRSHGARRAERRL